MRQSGRDTLSSSFQELRQAPGLRRAVVELCAVGGAAEVKITAGLRNGEQAVHFTVARRATVVLTLYGQSLVKLEARTSTTNSQLLWAIDEALPSDSSSSLRHETIVPSSDPVSAPPFAVGVRLDLVDPTTAAASTFELLDGDGDVIAGWAGDDTAHDSFIPLGGAVAARVTSTSQARLVWELQV